MKTKKILYIGGFQLPDKNAAAHRVIGVGKVLRELGHQVFFLNKNDEVKTSNDFRHVQYEGFDCYEIPNQVSKYELVRSLFDSNDVVKLIEKIGGIDLVIAYNYPAFALSRIYRYCFQHGIRCIADVADWHGVKGRSFVYKIVKGVECEYRMRCVHKKMDGLIVISDYLEKYYNKQKRMINIPPLVDNKDKKWNGNASKEANKLVFVYAGSPSSEKERLDILVNVMINLSRRYAVKFIVLGITAEQYIKIYDQNLNEIELNDCVCFKGRVSHQEVIDTIKAAHYSILIRDNNRVTRAGFPTKFVESISAGTPVICNDNSNVKNYITENTNGYLVSIATLKNDLEKIILNNMAIEVDKDVFNYTKYVEKMRHFLNEIFVKIKED